MAAARSPAESIRAVRELRAQIDSFAARYAAVRVAAGASARPLREAFDRLRRSMRLGVSDDVAQADLAFHRAILHLADVDGLEPAWEVVYRREEAFHRETIRTCWPDLNTLLDLHRPLLAAIVAGDPEASENATRYHLEMVWYRLSHQPGEPSVKRDPLAVACAYLALHMREPVRVSFVAKHVSRISISHLARLFKQKHGMSFAEYLRDIRIQRAAQLLAGTDRPIREIAAAVGYADPSRFAEHFGRCFGVTPRVFRRLRSPRA
jgi:AraC-like DNA-binding protein